MIKTATELLALHAGHRLIGVDRTTVRCVDCHHTLLLDLGKALLTEQDRAAHVETTLPSQACPAGHLGELAGSCRCCAANRKGYDTDTSRMTTRERDPEVARRGAALCRDALALADLKRAALAPETITA